MSVPALSPFFIRASSGTYRAAIALWLRFLFLPDFVSFEAVVLTEEDLTTVLGGAGVVAGLLNIASLSRRFILGSASVREAGSAVEAAGCVAANCLSGRRK